MSNQKEKMEKRMTRRALVLSLAMAAVLSMPMAASAQGGRSAHGGLFGSKNDHKEVGMLNNNNTTRGQFNLNANNQPFGETPIGGGILLLLGAGLGYAALKNRKERN